jgi:hypothetical protein
MFDNYIPSSKIELYSLKKKELSEKNKNCKIIRLFGLRVATRLSNRIGSLTSYIKNLFRA